MLRLQGVIKYNTIQQYRGRRVCWAIRSKLNPDKSSSVSHSDESKAKINGSIPQLVTNWNNGFVFYIFNQL